MLPFRAFLTLHRIGGPDTTPEGMYWPRNYAATDMVAARSSLHLDRADGAYSPYGDAMRVEFTDLEDVGGGWVGGRLLVADVTGQPLNRSWLPCLLYTEPWDVPTYTHIIDSRDQHHVLGIRCLGTSEDRKAEARRAARDAARDATREGIIL